jgi:integrase/recombinase XerD
MEGQVRAFLASLESQPTYSSSTRLAYDNDLRCFIGFLKEKLDRSPKLSDFSAKHVAEFLHTERQSGKRHSTILRRRASLRRFARFLRQDNPEWAAKFDPESHLIDDAISQTSPTRTPHYLSDEQVKSLWKVMESSSSHRARRDQAILALLLECGLTVGVLTALNLSDIDDQAGRLRLEQDDGTEHWICLGDASEVLRRYLKEGRPELNYQINEPALFISQTGGRMSRQGVWQALRQWGQKASLPIPLSPRLLRHTAVIRMVHSGRTPAEIQVLLGHSNPLSTQALLRRLMPETREAIEEEKQ